MKRAGFHVEPVIYLYQLQTYHVKHYSFAAQNTILASLEKWFSVQICRRTLNRWLSRLEEMRCIRRFRRHRKDKRMGFVFRSTAYYIEFAGWEMLFRFGTISASEFDRIKGRIKEGLLKLEKKPVLEKRTGSFDSLGSILSPLARSPG